MITFTVGGLAVDSQETALQGASDVRLVGEAGAWRLVVSAEADSALTVFGFSASGIGPVLGEQRFTSTSGLRTVRGIEAFEVDGTALIAPMTRYEDRAKLYTLAASGALVRQDPGLGAELGCSLGWTNAAGAGFLFAQTAGSAALTSYRIGADFALEQVQAVADTGALPLADISAMATARVDGEDILFVASAWDAGLASFRIGAGGTLTHEETILPGDGSGFARPSKLAAVEVEGQDFLVMASAGTSSLTVYAVGAGGTLTETDHEIDSLETRFQGASRLAAFTLEGRAYVAAAGSDDGVSVLEVTRFGQLRHAGSLADTYEITLDNVSGLEARVIDGVPWLFVTSPTDHGVTALRLEIAPDPDAIRGGDEGSYLRGTSGADTMIGGAGNDQLEARGGADVIHDGAGADELWGDGGRDTFVFTPDMTRDVIADFQPGYDTIDLSAYPGVSRFSDLVLVDGCEGVLVFVGGDVLLVADTDTLEMTTDLLHAQNFLF